LNSIIEFLHIQFYFVTFVDLFNPHPMLLILKKMQKEYPGEAIPPDTLSIMMTSYRPLSFRADASMLCEKDGKRQYDTKRRIYYGDDILPSYSSRQQILRCRSG
jgi:hypothetical protein